MNTDPRQTDPQFQSPLAGDSERASQFGMASQADTPSPGAGGQAATPNPAGSVGPADVMPGTEVYGHDGQRVGTVQEVYDDSFLVQKGIFFVHDYFIPYMHVARASKDRVDLTITSEEARTQDWARRPGASPAGRAEPMPPTADYGVYGPEGQGDTIQGATERGVAADEASASTVDYGVYGPEGQGDTIEAATERGVVDTSSAAQGTDNP